MNACNMMKIVLHTHKRAFKSRKNSQNNNNKELPIQVWNYSSHFKCVRKLYEHQNAFE